MDRLRCPKQFYMWLSESRMLCICYVSLFADRPSTSPTFPAPNLPTSTPETPPNQMVSPAQPVQPAVSHPAAPAEVAAAAARQLLHASPVPLLSPAPQAYQGIPPQPPVFTPPFPVAPFGMVPAVGVVAMAPVRPEAIAEFQRNTPQVGPPSKYSSCS